MLKNKRTIVVLSVCALVLVTASAYSLKANAGAMTLADKKVVYENAKKNFEQKKTDFENAKLPTTAEGINERYEQGIALKQQEAKSVSDLKQVAQIPVDEAQKLQSDIRSMKSVLEDLINGFDLNKSDEAAEVAKIKTKLAKIEQIEKDYKEGKKSFEQTKIDFQNAKMTKIN